jgi:hypothetical protein
VTYTLAGVDYLLHRLAPEEVSEHYPGVNQGLGQVSKSVETASNLPMPLVLLPFLGSGFVPTDSMPAGLRWFAEYQPFARIIETLRGLLMDTPIGNNAWIALAWCAVIALGGYLWVETTVQPRVLTRHHPPLPHSARETASALA